MSGESELFKLINKYFGYLKEDFGFEIVRSKMYTSFGGGEVIMSSDLCSVRIVLDGKWDEFTVRVGPPSSFFSDEEDKKNLWYDVFSVIDFLQQGPSKKENLYYIFPHFANLTNRVIWQIARLSRLLKPYWKDIFMFFSGGGFEKRKLELDEFIHEKSYFTLSKTHRVRRIVKTKAVQPIVADYDALHGKEGIWYYPCSVILKNNKRLECVVIVDRDEFKNAWEDNLGGNAVIEFSEIEKIYQSKFHFSPLSGHTNCYDAGESIPEGYKFRLAMKNGRKFPYIMKRVVNFPELPNGYSMKDVTFITAYYETPEEGPIDPTDYWKDGYFTSKEFYWCLV